MSVAHAPSTSRRAVVDSAAHTALSACSSFRGAIVRVALLVGSGCPRGGCVGRHHAGVQGVHGCTNRAPEFEQTASGESGLPAVEARRAHQFGAIRPLHWQPDRPPPRVLCVDVLSAILAAYGADHGQCHALQRMDRQGDRHTFRRPGGSRCSLHMVSECRSVAFPRRSPSGCGPAAPAARGTCRTWLGSTATGGCPPSSRRTPLPSVRPRPSRRPCACVGTLRVTSRCRRGGQAS